MLDRLGLYLDMAIAQCLPAVPGAPPTFADDAYALVLGLLALLAVVALLRGLGGRDDARGQRLKRMVLDD
jgi:hypothetical protein